MCVFEQHVLVPYDTVVESSIASQLLELQFRNQCSIAPIAYPAGSHERMTPCECCNRPNSIRAFPRTGILNHHAQVCRSGQFTFTRTVNILTLQVPRLGCP